MKRIPLFEGFRQIVEKANIGYSIPKWRETVKNSYQTRIRTLDLAEMAMAALPGILESAYPGIFNTSDLEFILNMGTDTGVILVKANDKNFKVPNLDFYKPINNNPEFKRYFNNVYENYKVYPKQYHLYFNINPDVI